MINGLSLFTGIGGLDVALSEYVRPIAYCESDPYCQAVLFSRMADESISNCPVWDDITTLSGLPFNGSVDIIYAGFPCQDISIAGTKKGLDSQRSGLFFHIPRLVNEIKPHFVFLENVSNVIKIGGNQIIKEFESLGMDCRWACFSAQNCGALHKRDRWFLLAYSDSKSGREAYSETLLNEAIRITRLRSSGQNRGNISKSYWEENKCPSFGVDDGILFGLDRAKCLGNSVVPQQAKKAFEILMGIS